MLSLLLVFSSALAETAVPEPVLSQDKLSEQFIGNLIQFVNNMDDEAKGLSLSISEIGHPLLSTDIRLLDNALDISGTVNGQPVHVQFSGNAVSAEIGGEVYMLPYSMLFGMGSGGYGVPRIGRETLERLSGIVLSKVILPSLKLQKIDGVLHYVIEISEPQLIALGDEVAADAELRSILSQIVGGNDFAAVWAQLRSALESGQIPVSISADLAVAGNGVMIKAGIIVLDNTIQLEAGVEPSVCMFNLTVNDSVEIAGMADFATGALKCSASAADFTAELDCEYPDNCLQFAFALRQGRNALTARLTETNQSLDGFFEVTQPYGAGEQQVCKLDSHYEKQTKVLTSRLELPANTAVDLNGAPENDSYHLVLSASYAESTGTVDLICTDTDELMSAELAVYSDDFPVMTGRAAYAKGNGAFSLRTDTPVGNVEGSGKLSWKEAFGTFTVSESGQTLDQAAFSFLDDRDVRRLSVSVDEYGESTMVRTLDVFAEYDKFSQGFTGTFWTPRNHNRIEVQGQIDDSLFRLKGTSSRMGSADIYLMRDRGSLIGNAVIRVPALQLSLTGNLLWSGTAKTLAFSTSAFNLNASLISRYDGFPLDLRLSVQDYSNRAMIEIKASRDGIYFSQNGRVTTIYGTFEDEHTYSLRITQNAERPATAAGLNVIMTADANQLGLTITDDTDTEYLDAVCTHLAKSEVELFDPAKAVLDPQLIEHIAAIISNPLQDGN